MRINKNRVQEAIDLLEEFVLYLETELEFEPGSEEESRANDMITRCNKNITGLRRAVSKYFKNEPEEVDVDVD